MAPVISSGTLRKMHRLRSRVVRPNLWEMAPLKWLTEWIQMDLEQIWFNLGRILKVFPGKWGMILSRRLINGCKDFCAWLIWLSENMRMCTMSRLWKYQNRFWCVKNIFFRLEWILRCNNKVFQRYRGNEDQSRSIIDLICYAERIERVNCSIQPCFFPLSISIGEWPPRTAGILTNMASRGTWNSKKR